MRVWRVPQNLSVPIFGDDNYDMPPLHAKGRKGFKQNQQLLPTLYHQALLKQRKKNWYNEKQLC